MFQGIPQALSKLSETDIEQLIDWFVGPVRETERSVNPSEQAAEEFGLFCIDALETERLRRTGAYEHWPAFDLKGVDDNSLLKLLGRLYTAERDFKDAQLDFLHALQWTIGREAIRKT